MVRPIRGELPTYYIEIALEDFKTAVYKNHLLTHPVHCPSKELNMIWHEKIFLIRRAAIINPFGSDWFAWADAGICTYREHPPPDTQFPDLSKLTALPHDKLIVTSSDKPIFMPQYVGLHNYYHFISGTSYALHRDFVEIFMNIYDSYLQYYLPRKGNLFTDQVILTYIFKDKPELFHILGHGYGQLLPLLY
jgi:hypothetical protein